MGPEQISDRETLERSLVLARKIHSIYGSRRQHNPAHLTPDTNTPPETIPPITLAIPNDITQSLIDGGCSPAAARTVSQTFVQSSHHIRAKYEALYHEACQKWIRHRSSDPNSPSVSGLAAIVQKQYRHQLLAAEKLAVDRARALSEPQCHVENRSSRSKPAFNQASNQFMLWWRLNNIGLRNLCPYSRNISNTTHILHQQTELRWLESP